MRRTGVRRDSEYNHEWPISTAGLFIYWGFQFRTREQPSYADLFIMRLPTIIRFPFYILYFAPSHRRTGNIHLGESNRVLPEWRTQIVCHAAPPGRKNITLTTRPKRSVGAYANESSQICPFLAWRPEFHSNLRVILSTPRYCQSATFGRLTFCVYTLLFTEFAFNVATPTARTPRPPRKPLCNKRGLGRAYMLNSSSSFVSFTQCSPTCGRMPLPSLSLWLGRQPCRPRLVGDRRGGGPSSVAPRSRNPPTGHRRDSPISSSLFSHGQPLCAVG